MILINNSCMLLTGIQETPEQSSTSTQREALSSVTNRFELQEVLQMFGTLCLTVSLLSFLTDNL